MCLRVIIRKSLKVTEERSWIQFHTIMSRIPKSTKSLSVQILYRESGGPSRPHLHHSLGDNGGRVTAPHQAKVSLKGLSHEMDFDF
jgi:hypothetical protein